MARRPHVRIRLERLKERLWAMPLRRRGSVAFLLGGGLVLVGLGGLRFTSAQEAPGGGDNAGRAARPCRRRSVLGSSISPRIGMRGDALDSGCDCHAADRVVLPLERRHEWEEIGPARGDVAIPAGKLARDWSFRATGARTCRSWRPWADHLYDLTASGMSALGARAHRCRAESAASDGRGVLNLRRTSITTAGLRHLSKMQSRASLSTREHEQLHPQVLRTFPRLKAVYLLASQITDAGLAEFKVPASWRSPSGRRPTDGCRSERPARSALR